MQLRSQLTLLYLMARDDLALEPNVEGNTALPALGR